MRSRANPVVISLWRHAHTTRTYTPHALFRMMCGSVQETLYIYVVVAKRYMYTHLLVVCIFVRGDFLGSSPSQQ